MKIGIITDTHDHHENVLKAVEIFNAHKVKYVLHAGDIVSPFAAVAFSRVEGAEFIAVLGNNEGELVILFEKIAEFGGRIYPDVYKGTIDGKRIFMTHRPSVIDEMAASGKFDLVIYGHTHKQDIRKVGDCLIINPGESTDWMTDTSCVVVVDTADMSHEVISLV